MAGCASGEPHAAAARPPPALPGLAAFPGTVRACASRVTVTTPGRAAVTAQVPRTGRRWLVSAVLSW